MTLIGRNAGVGCAWTVVPTPSAQRTATKMERNMVSSSRADEFFFGPASLPMEPGYCDRSRQVVVRKNKAALRPLRAPPGRELSAQHAVFVLRHRRARGPVAANGLLAQRFFVCLVGVPQARSLIARRLFIACRLGASMVGVRLGAFVDGVLRRVGGGRRFGRGLPISTPCHCTNRDGAENVQEGTHHGESP